MYWFKTEMKKLILQGRTLTYLSEIIGLTISTLSLIVNSKIGTVKTTAYAITKALNKDAEILDYFIRKER